MVNYWCWLLCGGMDVEDCKGIMLVVAKFTMVVVGVMGVKFLIVKHFRFLLQLPSKATVKPNETLGLSVACFPF